VFFIMKSRTPIALFIAIVSALAHGETFIGPTTATNRLLVPSNSAIIITATLGDFTNSTQVVLDGFQFMQSYFAPLESGNLYALAGPAELIFSNAVIISYYQITNSSIRTQSIANDPIGITIASNKAMRLFGVPACGVYGARNIVTQQRSASSRGQVHFLFPRRGWFHSTRPASHRWPNGQL